MIELRSDQRHTVDKAKVILREKRLVYIAAEMRTGKSIMGITVAYESGWKKVLFLTKKNAIESVKRDFKQLGYPMYLVVTNHQQAVNMSDDFDGIIVDEANEAAGAFPKPTGKAQKIKDLIKNKPVILMTGTPTPESWSQVYHQFWLSEYSPFRQYKNFYSWGKEFVKRKRIEEKGDDGGLVVTYDWIKKFVNGFMVNDYSKGLEEKIKPVIAPYTVNLSQEEAGFTQFVEEEIMMVPIDKRIYSLMARIKKDKVYTFKSGQTILADTPVRMQSIFHQLSSGTIKIEEEHLILDESKAWFIKSKFAGRKIAIFYLFIGEGDLLRKVFPDHTDNDHAFNTSDHLVYINQIKRGRSGVNLSSADFLIMYNIDFSATSYWQGRERMGSKDRVKANKMIWMFSENGFEMKVHKAVVKKKNYTSSHFRRDLDNWNPQQSEFDQARKKLKRELTDLMETDPEKGIDVVENILKRIDGC